MESKVLQEKYSRLKHILNELGSVAVAYSGGIDSTFLLKVAHDCLGDRAIGITIVSPSVPKAELEEAKALASNIGALHVLLPGNEMEDPRYTANTENRCYFCKSHAFDEILRYAEENGLAFVVDGTNFDDTDDFRPGRKAAKEKGVRSPLQEAGFSKDEIREQAKKLGLPNWNKPAAACLSSRIPYGSPVTEKKLSIIDQAERFLKELGLAQVRVRHHDQIARIEIEPEQFSMILNNRHTVLQRLKSIGYKYITLDLAGFRSGSMNESLRKYGQQ